MQVLTEILKLSAYSIVIVGSLLFFGKRFFSGYIDQKSKNLATKEDIGEITTIVEKVRAEHAEKLEEIKKDNSILISKSDKHLELKISIYTDALEAFSLVNGSIVKLSNLKFDEFEFAKLLDDIGAKLSRIQAVCSSNTFRSTLKIMTTFNRASLLLFTERMQLLQQKGELDELLERLNNSDVTEKEQQEFLDLNQSFLQNSLSFSQICFHTHLELMELLIEFVIAIREEIDIETTNDELNTIHNDFIKNMRESFDDFLGAIQNV